MLFFWDNLQAEADFEEKWGTANDSRLKVMRAWDLRTGSVVGEGIGREHPIPPRLLFRWIFGSWLR